MAATAVASYVDSRRVFFFLNATFSNEIIPKLPRNHPEIPESGRFNPFRTAVPFWGQTT